MSLLWDSNILRHYLDDHPRLLANLKKVPRQQVLLPVIVVAEQLRGRTEAILKAEPAHLLHAQLLLRPNIAEKWSRKPVQKLLTFCSLRSRQRRQHLIRRWGWKEVREVRQHSLIAGLSLPAL
jgi:hypothetical protein